MLRFGCALSLCALVAQGCGAEPEPARSTHDDELPPKGELPDQTNVPDAGESTTEPEPVDAAVPEPPTIELDPDQITMLGRLHGKPGLYVLCDPRSPDLVMGIVPVPRAYALSPASRQFYYADGSHGNSVRVLRADHIPYGSNGEPYVPPAPESNDELVATPPCATEGDAAGVSSLLFSATGELHYQCRSDSTWYDAKGDVFSACEGRTPRSIAANGDVLCKTKGSAGDGVVVSDGTSHEVVGVKEGLAFQTYRAKPEGGFWAAGRIGDADARFERWSIARDGTATLDGVYAPLPEGWQLSWATGRDESETDIALHADGSLYRGGTMTPDPGMPVKYSPVDDIRRFSQDFYVVKRIYSEATSPACMSDGVAFVTGR